MGMNQIAILPAGCLISSKDTLFSNEQCILYSSNLALYILNAQTFIVEKIIAVAEQTITSIVVSPHNNNLLIAAGCDGFLSLWMLKEEQLVCRVSVQANAGFLLAWDPFSPDHCAVLMNQPTMRLVYWDIRKTGSGLSELFVMKNQAVQVVSIKWNLLTQGLLAAGCNNGMVILFQISTKIKRILSVPDRTVAVVDIQWDRLSTVYLLVAYQCFISLWDTETLTEIHTFDKQGSGITAIAWMDWTVGNFVSSHCKNGYLKVWNVSQRQPVESIRVSSEGLVTVHFGIGTKRAICACLDGSVVVYHMVKMQIEHCTAAGHTEAIFDCTFSPASPDILATASYDGTVKLWNICNLSLTKTLRSSSIARSHPHTRCLRSVHREKSIVYCCDWSQKGNMLVGCTSQGFVIVWNVQTGMEISRYQHHTKSVYCVAWNRRDNSLIATTSGDCSLIVMEVDLDPTRDQPVNSSSPNASGSASTQSRIRLGMLSPKTPGKCKQKIFGSSSEGAISPSAFKFKYVHPASVFGCAWSHHVSTLLITCCMDGLLRVFDCALQGKAAVKYVLQGHSARAFVAVWSPLLPGTIASGSDDHSILIWKIDLTGIKEDHGIEELISASTALRGHSNFIRALAWSHEMQGLILSGAWDSSIRLWNIDSGECLHVVTDHSADVYAVASHPNRPFTFASCSRDTTVRLWELGGVFDCMRWQAVFNCGLGSLISSGASMANTSGQECIDSKGPRNGEPFISLNRWCTLPHSPFINQIQSHDFARQKFVQEDLKGGGKRCSDSSSKEYPLLQLRPLLEGGGSRTLNKELLRLDATSATPPSSNSLDGSGINLARDPGSTCMVSERLFLAQRFHKIFGFFCGANGSLDVLDGVLTLLALQVSTEKNSSREEWPEDRQRCSSLTAADVAAVMAVVRGPQHRLILHESEILASARNEARLNESARMSCRKGRISGKTEEQMRKAALQHARLGDFSKYCAIMVDLGEWTAALALAPCVSLEYWRELTVTHAHHLSASSSEQCIPYLVAAGADTEAVDFYLQRRDTNTALLLAKMSESRTKSTIVAGTLLRGALDSAAEKMGNESSLYEIDEDDLPFSLTGVISSIRSERTEVEKDGDGERFDEGGLNVAASVARRDLVLAVNAQAAAIFIASSKPIHAAAQLLAVGDAVGAVQILSTVGEDDLAYAVSVCMSLDTDSHLISVAAKMAAYHALPEALGLLSRVNGIGQRSPHRKSLQGSPEFSPEALDKFILEEMGLLLSRSCALHPNISTSPGSSGGGKQPKMPCDWVLLALEEVAIGCDSEATIAYVMGRKYAEAATLAVSSLRKLMRAPLCLSHAERRMLRGIKYLRAGDLESNLRIQFLSHLFWFAAHEAVEMGLWETGWCILRVLRIGLNKVPVLHENIFDVTLSGIKYQELVFRVVGGDWGALPLLDEILSNIRQRISPCASTSNPCTINTVNRSINVRSENIADSERGRQRGGEYRIPSLSVALKGVEVSRGTLSSWSEAASEALRNIGRLTVDATVANDSYKVEDRMTDDDLLDLGDPLNNCFNCHSVNGSNDHTDSQYAHEGTTPSDDGSILQLSEVVEILRRLRSLLADASNAFVTRSNASGSSIRSLSSPHSTSAVRLSISLPRTTDRYTSLSSGPRNIKGTSPVAITEDLKSSDIESADDGLWGPNTLEIQRLTQRLSDSQSLPSMSRFMYPPLKGHKSARAMSASASSRSVSGVGSVSRGMDQCRLLAVEGAASVEIIAKGSLLPVANLSMRVLRSCITECIIHGAVVNLTHKGWDSSHAVDYRTNVPDSENGHKGSQLLAGVNETLAWMKVLPFLPDMSGDLISYT